MLRLRISGMPVLKTLDSVQVLDQKHEDYCFNFHLSIFIDEIGKLHLKDDFDNKLIRVDWQGQEQGF